MAWWRSATQSQPRTARLLLISKEPAHHHWSDQYPGVLDAHFRGQRAARTHAKPARSIHFGRWFQRRRRGSIATGIGPIAHGNDIGGSVRIPALFNGVVGLRVSLGRIPSYNPSQQVARPIGAQLMAVQGPLTRSVRDARLALNVMARGDPCDTGWADVPLEGPPLPRLIRVALVPQNPGNFTHPAQAEAVRQAGRHLATAGYAVEEVTPPDLNEIIETWHRICSTDVLGALAPRVEEFGDADTRTSMRLWLELYPPTDIQGILAAFAQRDLLLWRWLAFTQRYPLVVMPTMGDLAPPHNLDTTKEGQVRVADSIRVSLISPLLGVPALAVAGRQPWASAAGGADPGAALPRRSVPGCRRGRRSSGGRCHADRSCAVSPAETRTRTGHRCRGSELARVGERTE